ncbi:MAG: lipoyl(octanoyl) transferase LipB [Bryobacteraceae bacterium]|nr:lipoyl(octanoyl) transferase LipB [Bryobacteraceae bacterium]
MRSCEVRDLGRMGWAEAWRIQRETPPDSLLFVEHPHTITLGRNAHRENILAAPEILDRAGIAVHEANRGGDVTYHGPGQIVGYPILDLNRWRRDVHLYVRTLEEVIIRALDDLGVRGERSSLNSGVWVGGAKLCAIGVHISRWITSHGFALNHETDLDYFRYIVPCGLSAPVTSLARLGVRVSREAVLDRIAGRFGQLFELEVQVLENAHS